MRNIWNFNFHIKINFFQFEQQKVEHLRFKLPIGKFKKLLSLKQTYDSNPNHIKQKFQSEIAKYLSLLIQNVGEVCSLSHDTNNFIVGTRKSGPIRRGKFYCNYRDQDARISKRY